MTTAAKSAPEAAAAAALFIALFLLQAFVIMVTADGLNEHVDDSIPAVGFMGSVWLTVALGILAAYLRVPVRTK